MIPSPSSPCVHTIHNPQSTTHNPQCSDTPSYTIPFSSLRQGGRTSLLPFSLDALGRLSAMGGPSFRPIIFMGKSCYDPKLRDYHLSDSFLLSSSKAKKKAFLTGSSCCLLILAGRLSRGDATYRKKVTSSGCRPHPVDTSSHRWSGIDQEPKEGRRRESGGEREACC